MFSKKHNNMHTLIGTFTAEAKAIAAAQADVAEKKRAEIAAAQAVLDEAMEEIKKADAFIENMTAMCCPAVKGEVNAEAIQVK